MSKRAKEIDVKLLLYAIQRTSNLEQLLAVRFTGNTLYEESGSVIQLNKVCCIVLANLSALHSCFFIMA